jgi:hypothetical protein
MVPPSVLLQFEQKPKLALVALARASTART